MQDLFHMQISAITGWSNMHSECLPAGYHHCGQKRTENQIRSEKNQFCTTLGNKSLFHILPKKSYVKGDDIEK